MGLFFGRKRTPLVRGQTFGEQFLRFMLLIAVFAVCGWLFWLNTQMTVKKLKARGAVWDRTGTLNSGQTKALSRFTDMFDDELGITVKLQIADGELDMPELDTKTLFIGLNLADKKAIVVFPPLVERAVGDAFRKRLEDEHFPPYFESGDWPKGLVLALADIWDALMKPEEHEAVPNGDASSSLEHRAPVQNANATHG
ncbi:TPM domain-containing protein [Oceanidesulfovibrio marinus]|uniref:TPM domain-containing protein n=1 Tax=Oceanidesulfovibrio marinus TaxID=370038 RepID=A0A6P1ZPB2_9BACT|nr:TPM domain-containing protein [Oceanidesulfovibrio marinus]QJT09212.1 TPM domain-containing protein [Oceanidesulfovibrio marinus]TVM36358.1 TPM domain-containing protein [Oceanidesulfovibrio marinus]